MAMPTRGRRVESPSSINTFRQCPRKYYYQYVERLPTGTSIHLIRGGLVHKVLEDFFELTFEDLTSATTRFLHFRLLSLFTRYWKKATPDLDRLGLPPAELQAYHDETILMLQRWFDRFKDRLRQRMTLGKDFASAFKELTPRREEEYLSEEFFVKGYIDVVHELDGTVVVMDYKTSSKDVITDEYRLQLAIYALLYEGKHGSRPHYVGIDFLKGMEQLLPVDDDLLLHARVAIEQIHGHTLSNALDDYPQRPSPLCKWRTGQCDFYDVCFGGMSVEEFRKRQAAKNAASTPSQNARAASSPR
jgi:CRISPR/Cas system-associated exonuclease Cas4 (RecB family)